MDGHHTVICSLTGDFLVSEDKASILRAHWHCYFLNMQPRKSHEFSHTCADHWWPLFHISSHLSPHFIPPASLPHKYSNPIIRKVCLRYAPPTHTHTPSHAWSSHEYILCLLQKLSFQGLAHSMVAKHSGLGNLSSDVALNTLLPKPELQDELNFILGINQPRGPPRPREAEGT